MTFAAVLFLIGVICIVTDMFAGTLSILWIGIAFLITSVVYYFTDSLLISLVMFTFLTIVSIYLTKKIKLNKQSTTVVSGVYAYIGRKLPIEEVDSHNHKKGTVSLNGETWNVLSQEPLKKKEIVEVVDVVGATLHVKKEEDF